MKTLMSICTRKVLHGWLCLEEIAQGMWGEGRQDRQDVDEDCVDDSPSETSEVLRMGLVATATATGNRAVTGEAVGSNSSCSITDQNHEVMSPVACASGFPSASLPASMPLGPQQHRRRLFATGSRRCVPQSRIARCALNSILIVVGSALIASYAVVHVHIIQEGAVFYTTWFYEWFLIPILLSLVFTAPLHRALGFCIQIDKDKSNYCSDNATMLTTPTSTPTPITIRCANTNMNEPWRRLRLLERDPTTQRLIAAVGICYLLYIVGDAAFFIPLSPNHSIPATYPTYLLALVFNIGFIYQGFLLTILTMRAIILRLNELEDDVTAVLHHHTLCTNSNGGCADGVTRHQILHWTQTYQELRQDMQSLSNHFGLRMVLGLTMFIVEVTNTILKVWDSVGSSLTKLQTCLLLLTYTSSATVLIITTFQTAYTSTTCCENIGPRLAMLSLRTNISICSSSNPGNDCYQYQYDVKAELNVLAQTFMQAPIHLRIGTFHITAEYANALAAWFFGLLLVVFGMKLPNY